MRRVARCDSSALGACFGTGVPCRPIYPIAPSCLDFVDWLVQIDEGSREDTWDSHAHVYQCQRLRQTVAELDISLLVVVSY